MEQDKEQLMESRNGRRGGGLKWRRGEGGFIYFGTEDTGREMERTTVSPLTVIAERGEFLLCWLLPSFLNSFLSG